MDKVYKLSTILQTLKKASSAAMLYSDDRWANRKNTTISATLHNVSNISTISRWPLVNVRFHPLNLDIAE